MTSFDAVLPLQIHEAFGWSSTGAGLIFLPLLLPCFTGPIIGAASDRYGTRWPAVVGFLLGCPGFICLRFVTQNTLGQKALLSTLLVIDGLGINLAIIPLFAEFAHVVDAWEKKRNEEGGRGAHAQGYGLCNCAFAAGCLAGPLGAGFVRQKVGWEYVGLMFGLLSAVSAIPACLWTEGSGEGKLRLLQRAAVEVRPLSNDTHDAHVREMN